MLNYRKHTGAKMLAYKIIEKKAAGGNLSSGEITDFITAYTQGSLPDYQMSALLMAIFIQGMSKEETLALTKVMLESGEQMDFSSAPHFVADKHSTGGVGDKISIPLAHILAALDIHIPMISGRGLGHSGGTLDKLESIPGFNVNLDLKTWHDMVMTHHLGLVGQSGNICPADKKLYALRDVTATVRSIPLISASIMSKKIAEGIQGLVLDVKTGNGAFMQTLDDSRALARSLVDIGKGYGIQTTALITDMDQPLGSAIGNWFEMKESVLCLRGEGPSDVMDLTYKLGAEILRMADPELSETEAINRQKATVSSGKAYEKLLEVATLQGGDISVLEDIDKYPKSKYERVVVASQSGYLERIDTMALGFAGIELGAGRKVISDTIDYASGMYIHKKLGDPIEKGEPLISLYSERSGDVDQVAEHMPSHFLISEHRPHVEPLIRDRIS
jgi:pyrimidine-nucleoside phosphorylase